MNKIISLYLIFFTLNSNSQIDKPKSVLATKHIYKPKTLALAVRFDKGIDSISFPVNEKLINVFVKKLDTNGYQISPKKIYYEYRFTAKRDTVYKLPSALVWSNGLPYKIDTDEYISLKKVPIEKSTINLVEDNNQKNSEKRRFSEENIISRISKNASKNVALLWTDKNIVKVNDEFKLIIESNVAFESDNFTITFINSLSSKFIAKKRIENRTIENGTEKQYIAFLCKAIKNGNLKINPLELKTENTILKTNNWILQVIK